jgi:hypothetical protein
LICLSLTAHGVGAAEVVAENFIVEAAEPGIQLYVRNKHPADMAQVPAGHVLLYVHGATQPSEATFDLPLEGASWMDSIAAAGWDVYLMGCPRLWRLHASARIGPGRCRPGAPRAH